MNYFDFEWLVGLDKARREDWPTAARLSLRDWPALKATSLCWRIELDRMWSAS